MSNMGETLPSVSRLLNTSRKHAYTNIMKILPPKNENFQIKNSDIFQNFFSKHRLWELVRTAYRRRF